MNSGESLGNMALNLRYKGKGRNGFVRNMWLGKVGIPEHKLELICKIAKVKKSQMKNHFVEKDKSSTIDDWVPVIQLFKKSKNPKPEIFKTN